MSHWDSRQSEYMRWCRGEREALRELARSFQSCAVQIERSLSLIAESKSLLAEADRLVPGAKRGEA